MRILYRVLYWLAHAGIKSGSNIAYGFDRKFKKPNEIPKSELYAEIKRLGAAIRGAS